MFIYSAGVDHPSKGACIDLLRQVSTGVTDATTRAEVIQELHHVYRRRGQLALEVRLGCDAMTGCGEILPVTRADILRSGDILLANPQLSPRDALHAATALNSGILTFVSTDADFDAVPGIARLDPGRA